MTCALLVEKLDFLNKYTVGSKLPKIALFQLEERAILTAPGVNNICLKISGVRKITNKRNVFSLIPYQPCLAQKV